jgi:gamma-polyglutamate biosynthesis protein CapA
MGSDEVNLVSKQRESIKDLEKIAPSPISINKKTIINFVGDVMLGRHVEYLMSLYGGDYPFRGYNLNYDDAYTVANFEASIPKKHVKTPNFTFKFSVNPVYLSFLKFAGFTHLSLANNHAYDSGFDGYDNTLRVLEDYNLASFGHPNQLVTSSVSFIELDNNLTVGIVGIHAVFSLPKNEEIESVLTYTKSLSDLQIVYIHWGNEYQEKPSNTQMALAQQLVTAGVDLIIGHHPHVVQSIERIDGALVFYSLGNYIFDQYFSSAVQTGLVVTLDHNNDWGITITPVSSEGFRAQPHQMTEQKRKVFLEDLAEISDPSLKEEIKSGNFDLVFPLATSSEMAIMTE